MSASMIKTDCKFGTFTVHNHDGQIWAEVEGVLYFWNEAATSGFPGCVQHGGNFLHGTEYRGPVQGGGDWVTYPHLEYGHVVTTGGLCYGANGYPDLKGVKRALAGELAGWERKNPEGGKNNEWIPLTSENCND